MSLTTQLAPIRGVCYPAVPSDDTPQPPQKYFDTDFTNSSFPLLWSTENDGRGDIETLAAIGVNFVHLYDWSVPPDVVGGTPGPYRRNHMPFLTKCATQGIRVFVPISNYFLGRVNQPDTPGLISKIVAEIYSAPLRKPVPAAAIWGIGNEFDAVGSLSVNDVVQTIALLVSSEDNLNVAANDRLPVTAPVTFAKPDSDPPGVAAVRKLIAAISNHPKLGADFVSKRLVASVNPFNPGRDLTAYIPEFQSIFPDLPFFFAEMGKEIGSDVQTEAEQAVFVAAQLQAAKPSGTFFGTCVFQFQNQSALKFGTEATFGMTKYSGRAIAMGKISPADYVPGGGESYPVDMLTTKPLFDAVRAAFLQARGARGL